jgi:RNA polymerase sigma-70 factor (ECF subfamily)
VLQEVAVAAWRLYDSYDSTRPFLPWVLGIARNKSVDAVRSRKPAVLLPADVLVSLSEDAAACSEELTERRSALSNCIQKLPPTLRGVLLLRLDDNLGVEAIAVRQGKSPNAIRKLLARARAFLAECTGRSLTLGAG